MNIQSLLQNTTFLTSAATVAQCPPDSGAEVAFAGRSNSGKSSAINTLCRQKKLARTSKTPGRTQLINFFRVDDAVRIVDLPGYGYAKVPEAVKRQWQQELSRYLETRQSLKGIVLLMDIRHPFNEFDTAMIEWASFYGKQLHILLTKSDKLSRGAANKTLLEVQRHIAHVRDLVSAQLFSSMKRQGLDQCYTVLSNWCYPPTNADNDTRDIREPDTSVPG